MEENRDTRRGKTRCWPMVYISWSLLWSSDAMSGCCVVVEKWVDDQAVARLGQGSSPEEDDDDDDVDVGLGGGSLVAGHNYLCLTKAFLWIRQ